jgi:hypothetical protein
VPANCECRFPKPCPVPVTPRDASGRAKAGQGVNRVSSRRAGHRPGTSTYWRIGLWPSWGRLDKYERSRGREGRDRKTSEEKERAERPYPEGEPTVCAGEGINGSSLSARICTPPADKQGLAIFLGLSGNRSG